MILAFDTETTGVDFYHQSLPFYVTTSYYADPGDREQTVRAWCWDVDPLTRDVIIPPDELTGVLEWIDSAERLVLHNAKFDATAIQAAVRRVFREEYDWPWHKTIDTTRAAHLLESNRPKNLTDLSFKWLRKNIEPVEYRLGTAVKECRRMVKQLDFRLLYGTWAWAEEGREGMPSARASKDKDKSEKDKLWKYDSWMPRTIAVLFEYPEPDPACDHDWCFTAKSEDEWKCKRCGGHFFHAALSEYSDVDPQVTLRLWQVFEREISRRKLTKIFYTASRVHPIAHDMERNGVLLNDRNLTELTTQYAADSRESEKTLLAIAEEEGVAARFVAASQAKKPPPWELPKNGVNNALRFWFDYTIEKYALRSKVDLALTEGGQISLNKAALASIRTVLPPESRELEFVNTLLEKRAADTALQYMDGYRRFALPLGGHLGWSVMHPSLNMIGTGTTRASSSNPNEQNISKREIECVRCDGEGCARCGHTGKSLRSLRYGFGFGPDGEGWSMDYQNLELRLPAYEADERDMIALFEEPDAPPYYGSNHIMNFHTIYPDLWDAGVKEVGLEKVAAYLKKRYKSDWYQYCKNGGFAIQYNAGRKTADAAFHRAGCFDLLKSRFYKLEKHNKWCIDFAAKHGYIETIPDRTVDPHHGYPLLVTMTDYGQVLPTVPLSYRTQGSAGWAMMKAMIRCQEQLDEWNRKEGVRDAYRIVMQVHDELVFRFPRRSDPRADPKRSNLSRVRVLMKLMAQSGDDYNIPTPTSCEYHPDNWSVGIAV